MEYRFNQRTSYEKKHDIWFHENDLAYKQLINAQAMTFDK